MQRPNRPPALVPAAARLLYICLTLNCLDLLGVALYAGGGTDDALRQIGEDRRDLAAIEMHTNCCAARILHRCLRSAAHSCWIWICAGEGNGNSRKKSVPMLAMPTAM